MDESNTALGKQLTTLMHRLSIVLLAIFLASCGNDQASVLPSDNGRTEVDDEPAHRISVQSILAGAEKGRHWEGEIIVKFRQGVRTASSLRAHKAVGATVFRRFQLLNAEHVKLPSGVTVRDAIIRYMQDPDVEYAEPNYIRSANLTVPNDQLFPLQWQLRNTSSPGVDISMPSAWDIIRGDGSLIIAVLDSGMDYTHSDLATNVWRNPGEAGCTGQIDRDGNGYAADCRGWNFVDGNNNPMDDEGHGTHISGVIGAIGNNSLGVAGMLWSVQIMPLKILDNRGIGTVSDEAAAIEYAIRKGAKIINASFAGDTFSSFEKEAIMVANEADVLFVTAAGNSSNGSSGDDNDSFPVYPGNYNLPNVISVAATDQHDHIASFSNYGLNTVHVAAPGVSILSTVPPALHSLFCGGSPLSGYEYCDGTSMATPHVTGLAGLLLGYYGELTPLQLRTMIMRFTDALPSLHGIIKSGGRINAYKAISALQPPSGLTANVQSSTQIVLKWNDNATGENGYRIERKTSGDNFEEIDTTGPDATSYADSKELRPTTEYTYRVRAFNTVPANSSYSNEAAATTLSGPGPTPEPSSGGGGCSVGMRHTGAGDVDTIVLLMPAAVIILILRLRTKK